MLNRLLLITALTACGAVATAIPAGLAKRADEFGIELDQKFRLHLLDAMTGKPIAGARVSFEGEEVVSNSDGEVTLTFPQGLGAGDAQYFAAFEKRGYVRARLSVRFAVGTIFQNRYSISPALPPGRLRIVLDWDKKPADLDSHLVKKDGWHISFQDMKKFEDRASLDRDSMNGFGPETITLARPDESASYSFFVHDFTNQANRNSEALANSHATVRVYSDAGLLRTFEVPGDLRGARWEVFRIVNGEIVAR